MPTPTPMRLGPKTLERLRECRALRGAMLLDATFDATLSDALRRYRGALERRAAKLRAKHRAEQEPPRTPAEGDSRGIVSL